MSTIPKVKLHIVRHIIKGKVDLTQYASVNKRIAECYNMTDKVDLTMTAINEVIDGYGVEAIRCSWASSYYGDICALYVNMGDTYDQTVVYDTRKGKYIVTSWGDFVERAPKYYGIQ